MAFVFTDSNFEQEALKSDVPVIVDFYADWCVPCKMFGPTVEAIAAEYEGKVKVGKLNTDQNPEIAQKYRIMSIPTVIYIKDGEVVDTVVGAESKAQMAARIDKL